MVVNKNAYTNQTRGSARAFQSTVVALKQHPRDVSGALVIENESYFLRFPEVFREHHRFCSLGGIDRQAVAQWKSGY